LTVQTETPQFKSNVVGVISHLMVCT
jgi:hypothetical protein